MIMHISTISELKLVLPRYAWSWIHEKIQGFSQMDGRFFENHFSFCFRVKELTRAVISLVRKVPYDLWARKTVQKKFQKVTIDTMFMFTALRREEPWRFLVLSILKLLFDLSPSSDVGWNFPDQGNDRTSELFSTKTKRKVFLEKTSIHLAKNYFFMKSFGAAKNQDLTKMSSKNTSNLQLWPRAMGNRFFTLWSPLVSQESSIRAKKSWICPYNRCRAETLGFDSLTIKQRQTTLSNQNEVS